MLTYARPHNEKILNLALYDDYKDYCDKWDEITTTSSCDLDTVYHGCSFVRNIFHIMQDNIKEEHCLNDNFINVLLDNDSSEFDEWDYVEGYFNLIFFAVIKKKIKQNKLFEESKRT